MITKVLLEIQLTIALLVQDPLIDSPDAWSRPPSSSSSVGGKVASTSLFAASEKSNASVWLVR